MVVTIVPIIRNDTGSVASDLSGASRKPARPLAVISMTMPVCTSA